MLSRPNTAPRMRRGNHSAIACCRRALAASSCALGGEQVRPALQQLGGLTRTRRAERQASTVDGVMLAALNAWSPMSTAMRWRETAASVSSGGIAARALEASVCARSTSKGVARPARCARGYEAQRLVLRGGDRAHRLELAQRADEREVVGRDVAQHQQAHAARAVFDRQRVGRSRSGACAQAAEEVDFPGHAEADLRRARIRRFGDDILEQRVVIGLVIEGVAPDADRRKQPRAADRLSGARRAHRSAAILTSRFCWAARRMRSDSTGILEALPPRDLRLARGCRRLQRTGRARRARASAQAWHTQPGRARATQRDTMANPDAGSGIGSTWE